MPTMFEKAKESLSDAAEYTKETAESAKEKIFGEPRVEDQAAEKVRDAADWTADQIGEAREKANENDQSFLDTVKEKMGDAVDYTKELAHSAKETIFGESGMSQQQQGPPAYNPRENTVKDREIFESIRDNNEDTDLPRAHDY